jgi:hypothetical protein
MNHIISSKNTLVYDIYIKSRETNPWVKKESAKVNLPKYRIPRDGHWTNQMTVKLSINNIKLYYPHNSQKVQKTKQATKKKISTSDYLRN